MIECFMMADRQQFEAILHLFRMMKERREKNNALRRKRMLCAIKRRNHLRFLLFLNEVEKMKNLFLFMISLIMRSNERKLRSVWSRPRLHVDFWEDRVLSTYTEIEFQQDFRMSMQSFNKLCHLLREQLEKRDTIMRKALTVERKVALTLYKLATPGEFRTIGNLFSVARSTACLAFHEVTRGIKKIFPITFPQEQNLSDVIDGFANELGFPQCCGAIDGTHIPIIAPENFPKDYYNRKGWHSVIMQAVVDHNGRFLDINIGWPGSVHDARVLANSSLFKRAQAGTLLPQRTKIIEGTEIPLLIIGDPAYPLKTWLMKGFSITGRLTSEQHYFNYRLSHARMQVENSFGRLKGRWRCLLKRNDLQLDNLLPVISACCSLHNFCETEKEVFHREWLNLNDTEQHFEQPPRYPLTFAENRREINIRNALVRYFYRQKEFLTEP